MVDDTIIPIPLFISNQIFIIWSGYDENT